MNKAMGSTSPPSATALGTTNNNNNSIESNYVHSPACLCCGCGKGRCKCWYVRNDIVMVFAIRRKPHSILSSLINYSNFCIFSCTHVLNDLKFVDIVWSVADAHTHHQTHAHSLMPFSAHSVAPLITPIIIGWLHPKS